MSWAAESRAALILVPDGEETEHSNKNSQLLLFLPELKTESGYVPSL